MCINCATYIGEVAEDVETIEHKGELAMKYAFGKASIPDQFIGIHRVIFITAATVFCTESFCKTKKAKRN